MGVPGRVVKRDNVKVPREDMDQINLPDPVLKDLQRLQNENQRLITELKRVCSKVDQMELDFSEEPLETVGMVKTVRKKDNGNNNNLDNQKDKENSNN